jgi:hypothetical protein
MSLDEATVTGYQLPIQPPEVDTAKTHRQTFRARPMGGQMGDYMIGDTPQHRIIGSVLRPPF